MSGGWSSGPERAEQDTAEASKFLHEDIAEPGGVRILHPGRAVALEADEARLRPVGEGRMLAGGDGLDVDVIQHQAVERDGEPVALVEHLVRVPAPDRPIALPARGQRAVQA